VVSQYLGAGDIFQAKKAMKTGIFGNILIALVLVVFIQIFAPYIFEIINTGPEIYSDALLYLRVVSFGFLFLAATQASSFGFKAFGHPKVVMYIVGGMNIVNVILNALLIFGLGPFPELGVEGAAYATFISKGVAFFATLFFLWRYLKIQPFFLKFKPLRKYYFKIVKIGLPSAGGGICTQVLTGGHHRVFEYHRDFSPDCACVCAKPYDAGHHILPGSGSGKPGHHRMTRRCS